MNKYTQDMLTKFTKQHKQLEYIDWKHNDLLHQVDEYLFLFTNKTKNWIELHAINAPDGIKENASLQFIEPVLSLKIVHDVRKYHARNKDLATDLIYEELREKDDRAIKDRLLSQDRKNKMMDHLMGNVR